MLKRNLVLTALIAITLLALAACNVPVVRVEWQDPAVSQLPPTSAPLPTSIPAQVPATSAPLPTAVPAQPPATTGGQDANGPSSRQTAAIQSVIQKANQEQVQAVTAQNPKVMQDTATSGYYQQSVQTLNDLLNAGVTAIQLVNIQWGPITLQNATTAQATTFETWSTTLSDGSTTQQTDRNVYTLVQQNGAWKVQDDQHPDAVQGQAPSTNPNGAPAPSQPVPPIVPPSGSQSLSRNWSGYAASGGTFTAVSATWKVPNVSTTTTGVDATWVGIGGVDSRDLIQAGTQAEVQGGQVTYSAWYETLPQYSQQVPLNVNPGDTVSVSITQQKNGTFQVVIRDVTSGQSWEKNITYQSSLSSAEWVEEAPSGGRRGTLPLDAFGSITFSNASTVENGKTVTIAQASGQAITMGGRGGQALAQPSALTASGDGFTVVRTDVTSPSPLPGRRGF